MTGADMRVCVRACVLGVVFSSDRFVGLFQSKLKTNLWSDLCINLFQLYKQNTYQYISVSSNNTT